MPISVQGHAERLLDGGDWSLYIQHQPVDRFVRNLKAVGLGELYDPLVLVLRRTELLRELLDREELPVFRTVWVV